MNLPTCKEDWEKHKQMFIEMGIHDSPESWTFILGQLQNTKMPELEFDPHNIMNHYKRWKIAEVLQKEKLVYLKALQDKLEVALGELAKDGTSPSDMPNGSLNPEGDLQGLPEAQEGMVPTVEGPGI